MSFYILKTLVEVLEWNRVHLNPNNYESFRWITMNAKSVSDARTYSEWKLNFILNKSSFITQSSIDSVQIWKNVSLRVNPPDNGILLRMQRASSFRMIQWHSTLVKRKFSFRMNPPHDVNSFRMIPCHLV